MKPFAVIPVAMLALVAGPSFSFATPADDIKAAARKLSDAANYSWITRVDNASAPAPVSAGARGRFNDGAAGGVTDNTTGYTVITRQGPNGAIEIVRKGDKVAVKDQQGVWDFPEELGTTTGGGTTGANAQRPRRVGRVRPGGKTRDSSGGGPVYTGSAPVPTEEVIALAADAKDLKASDDAISGELTAAAVASRLGAFGGGAQAATPGAATGTVTFWLKDGVIQKYEFHLAGSIQGRAGRTAVDRTVTTEVMDIGQTKVDVPEAARVKLTS